MGEIKFSDWFIKWFELYRSTSIREITKMKYMRAHDLIKASTLGNKDITKITREDAQKYIEEYGKNRSKQTVLDHLQYLRSCMGDAQADGLVKQNAFARVAPVYKEQQNDWLENKKLREKKKWLEVDEYERFKSFLVHWLNQALQKEPFSFGGNGRSNASKAQIQMMIIFIALKTGARFAEILGMTKSDVNYDRNEINIDKTWDYKKLEDGGFIPTKNFSSMRKVIVDSETIRIIEEYVSWLEKYEISTELETLFNEKGVSNYNSTINLILERVLTSVGIEPLSMHKLRHTQASYLLAKGVDIQVVAKRLGHTDTNMVRTTYGHLLKATEEEANNQIIGVL